MARNTEVLSLVKDMVQCTVNDLQDDEADAHQRSALTAFAQANSGRVNQFDITARMEGLEEKARILDNDPWADAFHDRTHELSTRSFEWTPEVLALLLQLSDRPIHDSDLKDLSLMQPSQPSALLTWSDIIADDPLDENDPMWQNMDFRGSNSEDDEVSQSGLAHSSHFSTDSSPTALEISETTLEDFLVPYDLPGYQELANGQFWRTGRVGKSAANLTREESNPSEMLLTVRQAVCETILMLLGLPTSLYVINQMEQIEVSPNTCLRQVSPQSTSALLNPFADIGTKLLNVRQWIQKAADTVPLLETFQASLASRLNQVDRRLSVLQAKLLDPSSEVIPSLLGLFEDVFYSSRRLLKVNEVLIEITVLPKAQVPFRMLESLYGKVCASQMIGDSSGYEYMAGLFFECFQTYLRPISLWIEQGRLNKGDGTMFIKQNGGDVPLSLLWQHRHHLIKDPSGSLHAPDFLHLAAWKIFNSGKSVDFLQHLGMNKGMSENASLSKPALDFENVCQPAGVGVLSPFSELFDLALDRWIASTYHMSSSMLREQLETRFGLQRSLDALEYIYFCRDGALSQNFTFTVIERIERGNRSWNNGFILTELVQDTYRSTPCIDTDHIEVRARIAPSGRGYRGILRPMSILENLRIDYTLPWPIANIIKPSSMETYQNIFIFLMQVKRAKYLLQRHKLIWPLPATRTEFALLMSKVRHRLMWFTDILSMYVAHMVLSAAAANMRSSMQLALDVDGMIEVHDTYIARLERQSFSTEEQRPTRQAIVSLLDLTILFSDLQRFSGRVMTSSVDSQLGIPHTMSKCSDPRKGENISENDFSDESESEGEVANKGSSVATSSCNVDRLRHIDKTFVKLIAFITAAVQHASKADKAACLELLANNLAGSFRS